MADAVSPVRGIEPGLGMDLFHDIGDVERAAGHRILKAWRKSRSTIDMLKKGQDVIAEIPHKKFHAFCADLLRYRIRKDMNIVERIETHDKLLKLTIETRLDQDIESVPLCVQSSGYGRLPQYKFVKLSELPERSQKWRRLYLTQEALAQRGQIPLTPLSSIEQAHALVKALHSKTDLLALYNTEGACFARANLIYDLLHYSGIPLDHLAKQYLYVPNKIAYGPMENWNYHVAVLLILADRTRLIIDPTVHADYALSVDDWMGLLTVTPSDKTLVPIENRGLIYPEEEESLDVFFEKDKCLTFMSLGTTELELEETNKDEDGHFVLSKLYPADDESTLQTLTTYRVASEVEWLEDAFFDLP